MKNLPICVVLFLAACASTPPRDSQTPLPPLLEQVGLRTAAEAVPACEPGHDDALSNGILSIRPGEVICVDVQVQGQSVTPMAVVSSSTPGTTLVVRAWHEPGKVDTFMTVHNPLGGLLRYEAYMILPGSPRPEYTSSCTVLSRRLAIEHWPYRIAQLHLTGFTLLPESQGIQCR